MSEVWNNVSVYGPPSLIEQFKKSCIHPEDDEYFSSQSGWDGCSCTISLPGVSLTPNVSAYSRLWVDNFQQIEPDSSAEYTFSFDTPSFFPEELLERLAAAFPLLHFDCACHHSMDYFMGYGWFNPPVGGEDFRQDFRVPRNYWSTGPGHKRSKKAQANYAACIERVIKEALRGSS